MQEIPEEIPLTEHFSFAEITWKIKNISIALCPLEDRIRSEEFVIIGREDTFWVMYLNISHRQNIAGLCLRMMGPKREYLCLKCRKPGLHLNIYANILDSNGEQPLKYERIFHINFDNTILIEAFDLSDLVKNLPHMGPDELTIRFYILVDHVERVQVPADVPTGLMELSKTLNKHINKPLHPDITVIVNNSIFHLHREMFSNIKGLGKYMDPKYKEAKLFNHCEYSIASIFNYAYSGDINYIIGTPRIRVSEDIERLGVEELFGAYPKEKIPLESTLEAGEYTCDWTVTDRELDEESLNGPEFNAEGTNTRWKISMHPKGKINGTVHEKKSVYLEATLLESTRTSIDVNIEFCCLNENKILVSRRDHRRLKVGDKLELPFLRRGGQLFKKCLIDGNLYLRITLWISNGQTTILVGDVIHSQPFVWANTQTINFFSRKMKNILAAQQNCDLELSSGNVLFNVHKFVLASRCSFFKNRMNNVQGQVMVLPDFQKHFMRVLLEYLYTGLYCDMEFNANCHMFEFGFLFDINLLKDRCTNEIDYHNLLRVFEYASDHMLQNLGKYVFAHIIDIGSHITEHPDWINFYNAKTSLALGIAGHWRN